MQLATKRALIQRFDILENVFKPVSPRIDFVLGERVEHECVVRVRRMSEKKIHQ
jgi:hypothetical protein